MDNEGSRGCGIKGVEFGWCAGLDVGVGYRVSVALLWKNSLGMAEHSLSTFCSFCVNLAWRWILCTVW